MQKLILPFFLLLITATNLNAQALSAGDIAFVEYNSINGSNSQSSFSFVILRAGGLVSGTTINFTDIGWNAATNSFGLTGEGIITWTSPGPLAQFTEVYITAVGQSPVSVTASTGNTSLSGDFILSQGGDQVLAYQGSSSSPTFISGIHMNSEIGGASGQPASTAATWDATASSNGPLGWSMTQTRSAIPPGLTNGTNAIMGVRSPGIANAEVDNGKIACANSRASNLAALRANLNNVTNWDLKDEATNPYALPTGCTFGLIVLPVIFGEISAATKDDVLTVNWSTYEERNNDHFEIQASVDGQTFKTLGTQKSLAANGHSDSILNYSFTTTLSETNALMGIGATFMIAILFVLGQRKKNMLLIYMLIPVFIISAFSCNKNIGASNTDNRTLFLRILQTDSDGTQKYSQVVKVVNE